LFFSYLGGIDIKNAECGMVTPDYYHPPLITDLLLPKRPLLHNQGNSYLNYASGVYFMLYESLANCDWSCVYRQTSVDLAVDNLNAAVNDAIVIIAKTNFRIGNLVR
jgi:hypothetical protein